jgi:hypothetical protein
MNPPRRGRPRLRRTGLALTVGLMVGLTVGLIVGPGEAVGPAPTAFALTPGAGATPAPAVLAGTDLGPVRPPTRYNHANAPAFTWSVGLVTPATVRYTWRPGCPVAPSALRLLRLSYWGFDGGAHSGRIIVNEAVVAGVVTVFRTLYDERFPVREMVPEDAYHGNDNAAAAADDTSGFNCRYAVAPGPPRWSVHAYGEAIDVNDVQNPYVDGATVIPPAGRAYLDRSDVRPGMAVPGGDLVDAFASVGWYWGGRWASTPDYQHFSLTGG